MRTDEQVWDTIERSEKFNGTGVMSDSIFKNTVVELLLDIRWLLRPRPRRKSSPKRKRRR